MEELPKSIEDGRRPLEEKRASGEDKVFVESPDSEISEKGASKEIQSAYEHVPPVHASESATLDKSGIGAARDQKPTEPAEEEVGMLKSMELTISHSVQAMKEAVTETFTGDNYPTASADLEQVEKEALLLHSAAHD